MHRHRVSVRRWVQLIFTALSNGYVQGFLEGRIYNGALKQVCVPGLNCYSCPGALGSCPIGALQAVGGSRGRTTSLYVLGFLVMVGAMLGRFVCGWLCPFGMLQDFLHKIPTPKIKKIPFVRVFSKLPYVILLVFVFALPMAVVNIIGHGDPWFCKYICPSGTLMGGLPLLAMNAGLRLATGWLFSWKVLVLVAVLAASMFIYRPFCRFLCPLGAIYGLFNPIALVRLSRDDAKCTQCGVCDQTCHMGVSPSKNPNAAGCIRCGDCQRACPHHALSTHHPFKKGSPHE